MSNAMYVAVYCSSSIHIAPEYNDVAVHLGKVLAEKDMRLVYGGGRRGLMGLVADSTMAAGGYVYGVTTDHLNKYELGHHGITEFHSVPSMPERKKMMYERADAFIILPGGFGTLEEFFEILTWKQIGLHNKHIVIVNSFGFWNPLKTLIAHVLFEKFATYGDEKLLHFAETVEEAVEYILITPKIQVDPTLKWSEYPTTPTT